MRAQIQTTAVQALKFGAETSKKILQLYAAYNLAESEEDKAEIIAALASGAVDLAECFGVIMMCGFADAAIARGVVPDGVPTPVAKEDTGAN